MTTVPDLSTLPDDELRALRCQHAIAVLDARRRNCTALSTTESERALWKLCAEDPGIYARAMCDAGHVRITRATYDDAHAQASPSRDSRVPHGGAPVPAIIAAADGSPLPVRPLRAAEVQPSCRPRGETRTPLRVRVHAGVRPGRTPLERFAAWLEAPMAQWVISGGSAIVAAVLLIQVARSGW